jgi:serine/threonine protein kinase
MWGMTSLDGLSTSSKYEALGRPLKQTIPFVDLWKQGELVCPIKVPRDLYTEEFYLGDFGLSKKLTDPITQSGHPPMQYCSPDRLHKQDPSLACDMWSYMIIFSMLYLTFAPFSSAYEGGVITGMVECLGPLPEHWKGLYPRGIDSRYDQSRAPSPQYDLASRIARFRPDVDPVERQLVQSIMKKVFTYCPEKRPSAAGLLRDPSFRAIMERYGC